MARWARTASIVVVFLIAFAYTLLACGRADLGDTLGYDAGLLDGAEAGGALVDGALLDGAIPSKLAITPAAATIAVGTQKRFVATGTFTGNTTADVSAAATWSTSDSAIASVALGVVSALKPGEVTLTATLGGINATAKITVPTATVASLAITPTTATTGILGTIPFQAVVTLTDGSTEDVTSTATWLSSNVQIATIAATGLATGVAAGQTTITATVGATSGKASLTVNGSPLVSIALTPTSPILGTNITFPFAATGTYSDGSIGDVTSTSTWASSAKAIVSITSAGVATSLTAGTSTITATVGTIVGTTTVTVTNATLVSIAITPATSTLAIHGTEKLVAQGTYSDNTTFDLTSTVTWSSADSGVAGISNVQGSAGEVTAVSAGSAAITAALGNMSGSATVTVSPATLVSIAITPADPSVPRGTTMPLVAKGTYSDGSILDITTTASWSIDDAAIATISNAAGSEGVVSATTAGTTKVHVTRGGVNAATTLTVTNGALVSITLTPASVSLVAQQKQAMTATATYSDGSVVDITATAVWTTASTTIASVSNAAGAQGLLTALAAGTTTVTATLNGKSGSATVTVAAPTLDQLVVSPIASTSPAGQQVRFQATAIYSNNTQQNVTGQASWSSSQTSVATITDQGMNRGAASALTTGTTTITATYQGLSGSTTLTVTSSTITSIQVSPVTATIAVGTTQAFQATAIYSDNTSQNVTAQATWVSSAPAVAGVTTGGGPGGQGARGNATGIAAGTTQITASLNGLSASATLTVTSAIITSISVSPATFSGAIGQKQQFTAQAIYSDGTSKDVTALATWTSSNTLSVGVNDAAGGGPGGGGGAGKGLATALAVGSADVSASYAGFTGSATFTVTSATLTTIQITPFAPTVLIGFATTLTATGIYSDNTTQDLTALATWTSSAPSTASVSTAAGTKGHVSPLAAGTATLSAIYAGVTGTDDVTVSAATLQSVSVTPATASIARFATQSFVATGTLSDATTLDVTRYVTWLSSASSTASISNANGSQGFATGLASGDVVITAVRGSVSGTASLNVQ